MKRHLDSEKQQGSHSWPPVKLPLNHVGQAAHISMILLTNNKKWQKIRYNSDLWPSGGVSNESILQIPPRLMSYISLTQLLLESVDKRSSNFVTGLSKDNATKQPNLTL